MAINKLFIYSLAFTLLFTLSISTAPSHLSPAPSPLSGADDQPIPPPLSSPPVPPPESDLPPSPSSPASPASPPASDNAPTPDLSPSTAPESPVADVSGANLKTEESTETKSGGMSSGKKAGIAIGVIAAAFVVGVAGVLYKKRQQNIRRAEFSSAARREFL